MKAVIIEDEPHARQELKRLLTKVDDAVEVVAELESVEEATAWLQQQPAFDLLLVDIQLGDGISFDIFNKVEVSKPVIFITAYNDYAIRAFELNSIDYLLKPVEEAALEKALTKLHKIKDALAPALLNGDTLRALLGMSKRESRNRFLVKLGDQFRQVMVDDIAYFEADRNLVSLVTRGGQQYVVDYNLEQLEQQLDPATFFRASRGVIVHINSVKKVHKYFNSRLQVETEPPMQEKLTVSRLRADDFLKWMGQ